MVEGWWREIGLTTRNVTRLNTTYPIELRTLLSWVGRVPVRLLIP
jgi:hypothetical protein